MFLVDSHCHLDSLDYQNVHKDVADVIARAHEAGVTHFLCPGVDLESFPNMYEMVKDFNEVWCACAIHPENINEGNRDWKDDDLRKFLALDRVIAVGETGLDYVCTPETRDLQIPSFVRQIHLAVETDKPLIIHTRGSALECMDIMKAEGARDCGGVMHCFCEGKDEARKALDLGFYISFSGIVTFKNGENVREACRYVPADMMLVETDSPYLAPVPKRGKPNEPAFVAHTARAVAEIKNIPYETLCEITSRNFSSCFKVSLS
ncbi:MULTISPECIES: TatD family hydrolase [Ruminobacter]|jgi:TatD DNase family protein|uniref:TatD DNase family protein n=1 Tax=Ruminobacter amylophilus TaxID=867 RepID=A0A662ZHU8_9GAMM|nr:MULTISPECIES: TatD family hydrolase [Ruminobacter]SFP33384.1 TatD DNase family protein [Ruminobacter amylophilus]